MLMLICTIELVFDKSIIIIIITYLIVFDSVFICVLFLLLLEMMISLISRFIYT